MSNPIRCPQGHFYDPESMPSAPTAAVLPQALPPA